MKKNGFTLVELLAVIAILAILIILALPNTIKFFNESKENAFIVEVKKLYESAKQEWMKNSILNTTEVAYARTSSGDCSNSLNLNGRKEINYYIKINKNGNVVEYYAEDGTYQYTYSGDGLNVEDIKTVYQIANINESDKVSISCNEASGGINDAIPSIATFVKRQTQGAITIGDEVIIAEDHFYVVSSNNIETVLLAKYDLNTKSNAQVSSNQTKSKFANKGYWDEMQCEHKSGKMVCGEHSELLSPYSDDGKVYCESINGKNCAYIFDDNCVFYAAVNNYAHKIAESTGQNISGRLMTLDEAKNLKTANSAGTKAIKDQNGNRYWLGTVFGKTYIWNIDSSGVINGNPFNNSYGIRPVIIVSTPLVGPTSNSNNAQNENTGNTPSGTNIAEFVTRQVDGAITVGDELKINEENFYVISSNNQKTSLLAKYDLNTTTNVQVTSGQTKMSFAYEGYWDGLQCRLKDGAWSCIGEPEGLLSQYAEGGKAYCEKSFLSNCPYVYDGNSNLSTVVDVYADKIEQATGANVTGRLMTLEEAARLADTNQTLLNMIKDQNGNRYWLGTAYGKRFIWNIDSSGNFNGNMFNSSYGVRPVIEVPTSSL